MAPDSNTTPLQHHDDEEEAQPQDLDSVSHNPPAPPDELFDISTTVDPSYVISLIRKLLPASSGSTHNAHSDISGALIRSIAAPSSSESMEINDDFSENNHGGNEGGHGLIELIVDQMFLNDAQCLCEVCRLLTVGVQSSQGVTWAEALRSEHNLTQILWIAENSLNPQLIEKSAELLLAIIESSPEVVCILLPPLMKLGLASLLINLLDTEISKLMCERAPERYPILDVILRAIEALSVIDDHSQDLCLNKELFQLVCNLLKFPYKVEVANSSVTAVVLVANILSDVPGLAAELSGDILFVQGLLDVFPFTSDDIEARSALWNIIARLLLRVKENEMSLSTLQQYVSVLVSKSDVIEDDLLDCQLGGLGLKARHTALRRIISILNQWTASNDNTKENDNDLNISRLLDCCCKHSEDVPFSDSHDMDLKE